MIQYIVIEKTLKEYPNELLKTLVQVYQNWLNKPFNPEEEANFEKWYSDEQKKIVLQADMKNFNKLMAQNDLKYVCEDGNYGKVLVFYPYEKHELESLVKRLQVFKHNDYLIEEEIHDYEFLINTELSMSLGKLAAQIGHVCVEISKSAMNLVDFKSASFKLVSEIQLLEKVNKGFPYIRDNGHTEIEKGSLTVVANKKDPS